MAKKGVVYIQNKQDVSKKSNKSSAKVTKKKSTSTGITTIYAIRQGEPIIYIGSTDRLQNDRWIEHKKALEKGKHSNKSLQKKYDENSNFTYEIVMQVPTDNTLIKFFVECLVNSIHKPCCNKCIISQGRMRIILQRCDSKLAQVILDVIDDYYKGIE